MSSILEKVVKNGELGVEELLVKAILRPVGDLKSRVDTLASKVNEIASNVPETPIRGIDGVNGQDGLQGRDGINGKDGKKGENGLNGRDGKSGLDGKDGKDGIPGISIVGAEITFDNHLVITLSDGNEIDAGAINIESKTNYVTQIKGEEIVSYSTRYDQVSDALAYKGEAIVGASEGAPLWRIQKLVFGVDGDVAITWVNGNTDFRFVWTDRATLTYI